MVVFGGGAEAPTVDCMGSLGATSGKLFVDEDAGTCRGWRGSVVVQGAVQLILC
jgi:hypothetical protein